MSTIFVCGDTHGLPKDTKEKVTLENVNIAINKIIEKQVKADLYLLLKEYNSYEDFNTFMFQLIEMHKANIDKEILISLLTSIHAELTDNEEWEKEDLLGYILDCMTGWGLGLGVTLKQPKIRYNST